ncbi:MAG: peptidoglycan DD-metalloendopeptidase family protein [Acidimicrobiales bacterium]
MTATARRRRETRPRRRRTVGWALTALVALPVATGPAPAVGGGISDPVGTTTIPPTSLPPTSVPSTTTTVEPPPTTPAAPATSGGQAAPGGAEPDESRDEDIPPDRPPDPSVVVPPLDEPAPLSGEQVELARAMAARLEQARLSLMVSLGLEAQAVATLTDATTRADAARTQLARAQDDERAAAGALRRQRERVNAWAVQAYTGGSLRRLAYVLESDDINDLPRRIGLVGGAFGAFEEELGTQKEALDAVVERRRELTAELAGAEERLIAARTVAGEAARQVAGRQGEVAALDAGQAVSIGGVAFPVAGPTRFAPTFGAPRMAGTRFAHAHQGVDIFAPPGAPVVSFERGAVVRLGFDVLGGIKLWLVGQSGTRYYYAHLQGYVPQLAEGQVVEVGQTLAFVGDTGNAAGSGAHLHFEIHPGGGPAVDPYPVIAQIAEAARIGASALAAPSAGTPAATGGKPG